MARPSFRDARILAVGAHPDDIELGCFGTLARARSEGASVTFLVLTWGGAAGSDIERKDEATAAAKLIDADLLGGGLVDREILDGSETITVVEDAIERTGATMVFVNSPEDTHQDHRNAARAAVSAARFVEAVLFFHTPSSGRTFRPSVYVDVTDFMHLKTEAVAMHVSQGKNVYMADRAVLGLAEFLGMQVYRPGRYYEGFEVHQQLW